ncbi:MAG: putative glycoside hydrolase [Gemmatimonadaceae bacterium]|nr:putative glycoside hydrolase [Gemmatimonadaceae bacterium]
MHSYGRTTSLIFTFASLTLWSGCTTGRDAAALGSGADSVAASQVGPVSRAVSSADSQAAPAGPATGSAEVLRLQRDPNAPIRGLYLNRFSVQSSTKLRRLIALADSTEINAFVIDIKDEFGLNFVSADPMLRKNAGTMTKAVNLKAWVDSMRAHGILPIARIVVFKDSVASRMNPTHTIRKADGSPWRDREGLTWVNPYSTAIWEYNFRVGDEAIRMGFGEIQFDYIRFPEPYKSLPQQVFPGANNRGKPQVLAEFLATARARYARSGIRTTADVFGLVTTVNGALEIGQQWEPIAKVTDVVLPMVYPSHYPRGSFGIARPNAEPYRIIHAAISRARERNAAIGVTGEHVRPWLQAFSLGQPKYGPEHIRAQKQAVYDSGYDGWVLWHPGSNYDIFVPALERTLVSRKKVPPVPVNRAPVPARAQPAPSQPSTPAAVSSTPPTS